MTSIAIDRLDGLSSSTAVKGPCRAATTANITLSGEQTIDGVSVVSNDRVLVKDQSTSAENGIYVASTSTWRRSSDFESVRDIRKGTLVRVTDGAVNADSTWAVSTANPVVVGSSAITFENMISAVDVSSAITAMSAAQKASVRDDIDAAPYVVSRTALKALDTTKDTTAYFDGNLWDFVSGNYSAEVAADAQEGIYIKADDTAAASGAWIRRAGYHVAGADAHWFQLSADGSTSDSAKIQDAVDICALIGVKKLRFREYEYALTSTVTVGDGTSTSYSTINGVELVGVGAPFLRLANTGGPQENNGTRFKWTGASGGTMIKIAGPSQGNGISNIALNCNSLAAKGLEILSGNRGKFLNLTVASPEDNGVAIDIKCVAAESISSGGTQTEAISAEGNYFRNTRINLTNTDTTGIRLDGYTGSASNGKDPLRSQFFDTYILATLDGSVGIEFGFTDQNNFHGTYMSTFGVSNGNEASLKFTLSETVPGGYDFPQTINFTGHTDLGQNFPVVCDDGIGPGISIDNRTFLDQQEYLTWPATKYIRTTGVEVGAFPKGGFWGEEGLALHERGFGKNRLINPTFRHAVLGTSRSNPPSGGAATVDGLFTVYDGTVSSTLSRQDFTHGQTDVPYEPKHFMRWAVTSASGQSFTYLSWRIPNAALLEGRKASLQLFMKTTSTSRSVSLRCEQNFGTGGSPSSTVAATSTAQTVGTSWAHYVFPITLASTSGKTFGTDGNDKLIVALSLPIDTTETWEIALPDFGAGWHARAFEIPPYGLELQECREFVRLVGAGCSGSWSSASAATIAIDASSSPMHKAPTASLAGASVTLNTPGDGDYTATPTLGSTSLTKYGGVVSLSGFTGATALRPLNMRTNDIVLSAYP